jgi:lipopolysaccharide export system permease protein
VKRLTVFSIRSFAGPFVVTFFISLFMLIMQFFWKYIDDFMGKGLEATVVLEVLFYISASLIPLALPLAMLLSSIMTFGNLAESNELTALKSSGLSLYRIMRPLIVVVIVICLATFYFANYVIPVANFKWHALISDIQQTKVAALLTPGSYSTMLDGYAIKVEQGKENSFTGITIHDYSDRRIIKTIKADSGAIYRSRNGKFLFFRLINGKIAEEMHANPPVFQRDGKVHRGAGEFRPSRRTSFSVATYKMDLSGFELTKSNEEDFKDQFEMLNVFQISEARDSMQRQANATLRGFVSAMERDHPYFLSVQAANDRKIQLPKAAGQMAPDKIVTISDIKGQDRINALNTAIAGLRRKNNNLYSQKEFFRLLNENSNHFSIEFHKKMALTVSILVLFFIGAPLGAIVRKGGFGAPVVIAALLFMIYFVLTSVGEGLAQSNSLSPFWGLWLPAIILAPVALILLSSAANDLSVFDRKFWRLFFTFGKRK